MNTTGSLLRWYIVDSFESPIFQWIKNRHDRALTVTDSNFFVMHADVGVAYSSIYVGRNKRNERRARKKGRRLSTENVKLEKPWVRKVQAEICAKGNGEEDTAHKSETEGATQGNSWRQ